MHWCNGCIDRDRRRVGIPRGVDLTGRLSNPNRAHRDRDEQSRQYRRRYNDPPSATAWLWISESQWFRLASEPFLHARQVARRQEAPARLVAILSRHCSMPDWEISTVWTFG
jgi:hypothetical protein